MSQVDEKQNDKKESFSHKYRWQIIVLFITGVITITGAIIRAQSQIEIGLVLFIGGSLLTMTVFLGTLTMKAREDVDEIVREKINRIANEFRSSIGSLSGNLAAIWTPTIERNIEVAEDITQRIGRFGPHGAAYDTSSHPNPDSYENVVLQNVKNGVFYQRLICFDPEDENSPTRQWYLELMSGEYDKEHRFSEWRKLMREGKVQILHLPRSLDMDILVTNIKGTNKYDALLGFITEETTVSGVYNSGLYVPAPAQTADKNLANDIYGLFKKLWREASFHAVEQKEIADPEDRCICNIYLEVQGNVVKNAPVLDMKEESSS